MLELFVLSQIFSKNNVSIIKRQQISFPFKNANLTENERTTQIYSVMYENSTFEIWSQWKLTKQLYTTTSGSDISWLFHQNGVPLFDNLRFFMVLHSPRLISFTLDFYVEYKQPGSVISCFPPLSPPSQTWYILLIKLVLFQMLLLVG